MTRFKDIGEFGFIDRIAAHAQRNRVLCGIGDDCAVIATGEDRVRLVTTDAMVEGVHFVQNAPPESVGYKLLTASLSDIAAMGGEPTDVSSGSARRRTVTRDMSSASTTACLPVRINLASPSWVGIPRARLAPWSWV